MGTTVASVGRRRVLRHGFAGIATLLLLLSFAQPASAGTAKKLGFGVQPVDTIAGRLIAPAITVRVLDQQNRLVSDSTAPITIAFGVNPSSATLYGAQTANAVAGIATFSALRILPAGNGFTLAASSPGLLPATSGSFNITGAGTVCSSSGCVVDDPGGTEPTRQNATTGSVQVPNCPGAETNSDFLSYNESDGNFCAGACHGAAVFFDSECTASDTWLIVYRIDKTILPTDKGAPHVVLYIENSDGSGTPIPDCVKAGILNPGPICISSQNKNGQGDSVTQILKSPGDPRVGY